ncbi:MAG TPA: class I SAM-dependent methyltransferase [Rhodoblastus sp.]|nr:class I SAM-dependent methyltransferase [Rhodoblastus sp.]
MTAPSDKRGPAGLDAFLAETLQPAFWTPELLDEESAFWPHAPFVFWLMAATRPRVLVELGVDRGVSYAAFCEAARRLEFAASFCAIDPFANDDAFADFQTFHDVRYAGFSRLVRKAPDEAFGLFADRSIDLLHINASALAGDPLEIAGQWRAKLSPRGLMLIHGATHGADGAPTFHFPQGEGLTLIAPGAEPPQAIAQLCALDEEAAGKIRANFGALGARWAEKATILGLLRQFERDFLALTPKDKDFRLTLLDRFHNSFVKTTADPWRYFRRRKSHK